MYSFKDELKKSGGARVDSQADLQDLQKCLDYCVQRMFDANGYYQSIKNVIRSKVRSGRYELINGRKYVFGTDCFTKDAQHTEILSKEQETCMKNFNADSLGGQTILDFFSKLYPDIKLRILSDWDYRATFTYERFGEKFKSGFFGNYHYYYINERYKRFLRELKELATKDDINIEIYFDVDGQGIADGGRFKQKAGGTIPPAVKLVVKYSAQF